MARPEFVPPLVLRAREQASAGLEGAARSHRPTGRDLAGIQRVFQGLPGGDTRFRGVTGGPEEGRCRDALGISGP